MKAIFRIECVGGNDAECAKVAKALSDLQNSFSAAELIELSAKLQNPNNVKLIKTYKAFLK